DGGGAVEEGGIRQVNVADEEVPELAGEPARGFRMHRQRGDQVHAVLNTSRLAARRDGVVAAAVDRKRECLGAGFVFVRVVDELLVRVHVVAAVGDRFAQEFV